MLVDDGMCYVVWIQTCVQAERNAMLSTPPTSVVDRLLVPVERVDDVGPNVLARYGLPIIT